MGPLSRDEELGILRKAIQAYAPSWEEGPVIDLLTTIFDGMDTSIARDSVGNVIISAGSGTPTVLLASHLDTIANPLEFKEDDETMTGRGAVDCRAPLFMMALALRRCIIKGFNTGKIVLAGIVAEEISTKGINVFLSEFAQVPDYAIFGEPTNLTKVCIGYKGRVWLEVRVTAKPGHVASAWLYVNAIEALQELHDQLSASLASLVKKQDASPFYTPKATITTLHAGSIPNMLPREATADIDIRFPPGIKKESVIRIIEKSKREILEKYMEVDPSLEISTNIKSGIDAIRVPTTGPLGASISRAIKEITGKDATFVKKTGTTFMNHIGNHFKVPIITYGPGDPALEHTDKELVRKQDFLNAIDILEKTLGSLLAGVIGASARSG
nr:M20/M25/M40 family metallo-hydrolase [Candidatus Sigynarchaeota archaeon]